MKFEEIREKLLDDILALAKDMAPGGRVAGKYWISRNPTRDDRHAGSFWILLEGQAKGAWRDEAGIRGVDEGDVVKLVQYCRRLPDLTETRKECLKWLGLSTVGGKAKPESAAEREARQKARAQKIEREAAQEAERRQVKQQSAFGMWMKALELTPANFADSLVHRYLLEARSIDLLTPLRRERRPLPGAIRWFREHDYHTDDGEVIEGLPCMIALITGPDGKPRGVHRTWLQPDGGAKAELPDPDVNAARKIWPAGWQSGVIRIAKGAGHLSPEQAEKQGKKGPLILTEGIEDALTVSLAMPDYRVWAAGTLGNLEKVPVLPCVSSVIVCADNDWGKPQAMAQLDKGIAALRRQGRPVSIARSPRGKDMNDLLKGERA